MQYHPPISVSSDTEATYTARVYHDTRYDIKSIFECITHGYLDKASIPNNTKDYTLNIYIGDEGYNIFIAGPKEIEEYLAFDSQEAISLIEKFLSDTL